MLLNTILKAIVMFTFSAVPDELEPAQIIEAGEDLAVANWRALKNHGIQYSFTETTDFRPQPSPADISGVVKGKHIYWVNQYRYEFSIFSPEAAEMMRTAVGYDGTVCRSLIQHFKPKIIPPPAVPIDRVSNATIDVSEPRPRFTFMNMDVLISMIGTHNWLRALAGMPERSYLARVANNHLPVMTHSVKRNGTLLDVTSFCEDENLKVRGARFNGTRRIVYDDAVGGMPVSIQLFRSGALDKTYRLSWLEMNHDGTVMWLMTNAETEWPFVKKPGSGYRQTLAIDPASIHIGDPIPADLEIQFPGGTKVSDRINNVSYISAALPNGQDYLDATYQAFASRVAYAQSTLKPTTVSPDQNYEPSAYWKTVISTLIGVMIITFSKIYSARPKTGPF